MALDAPNAGSVMQPFTVAGWALDSGSTVSGTGVDTVHLWAFPTDGRSPIFLAASYGVARTDVAAILGAKYLNSGYASTITGLLEGVYQISASAHSTITNQFEQSATVLVSVSSGPAMAMDAPTAGAVPARFAISGWAVDRDSPTGTGVDAVHVWAYPSSGAPRFIGAAAYGLSRPDIGAIFGGRFTNSGWSLTGSGLPPGAWTLVASMHSTVTGTFRRSGSVTVQVPSGSIVQVDAPVAGSVTTSFSIAGWAVDLAASSGTGIGAVHIWAFPVGGGTPRFVGAVAPTQSRPDVGAVFGAQFTPAGYQLTGSLPAGLYDLAVYAQSTVTGTFDASKVIRIAVH
jgi:hypothetical protein